jgi:hypothetical protein
MLDNNERRYYTEGDINLPNYTWTEYPVNFYGNGMVTTDRNATGRFSIIGTTVFWHVDVNFTGVAFNSTNALYITIPFPAAVHTDSSSGALHDVSTGKTHGLKGHYEKYDRFVQLFYVNNQIEDVAVTHNQPVTLATEDYFHICGWYEAVFND